VLEQNTVGFKTWCENGKGIFWIQGKPGSGKSILLKYLLSEARTKSGSSNSVAGFFFNGRGFPLERCIEGMLRSLLVQLLSQFTASFPSVLKLYKQKLQNKDGGQFSGHIRWSRSELQQALISVVGAISAARRVLLFLDALDECKDSIMETVEFLQDIINQNNSTGANICICVSARPVGPAVTNLGSRPALYLEQHTAGDILAYTEARIAFLGTTAWPTETADQLKKEIIQKADGVFLWVTFVTESLRKGYVAGDSINELRRTLSSTPSGLAELYRHTLEKIDEQYKIETRQMFQIVLAAARPLSLSEFRHILAFESTPSFSSQKEMKVSPFVVQDNSSMEARLLSRCGGLLEVVSKNSDTCQIIQLIHQSVSDFLKESPTSNETADDAYSGANGDLFLLRSCVHYLSISELKDVSTTFQNGDRWTLEREIQEIFTEYPLLEYAVKKWNTHWEKIELCQTLQKESLHLIEDLPLQRWIQIYNLCNDDFITHPQDTDLFTIAVESNVCGFCQPQSGQTDNHEWEIWLPTDCS
jgi:AAA ATPase domain